MTRNRLFSLLLTITFAACSSADVPNPGSGGSGGTAGSGGTGGTGGTGGSGGSGGSGGQMAACTVTPQSGCMADQSCDYYTNGMTFCRTAMTGGDETKTCTSGMDCAISYGCFGSNNNNECMKYCTATSDCTAPGGTCIDSGITGVKICTANCDPKLATGCPMTWGCEIFAAGTTAGTYCRAATAAGTQGVACTQPTDCAAGYTCVTAGNAKQCKKICAVGEACPGATLCSPFSGPNTIGGVAYGICN